MARLPDRFAGDVILPGDPGYDSARVVWNGMFDRKPAMVVRPRGTSDVVEAVRFAREEGLVIAVRGGGHSIPGFSTCDDGIVVDLSRMRGVDVDPQRRVARTNGGALLVELDQAAQDHGLVCPVGVVSHTGVAGLTLGGGMGRLQRKHGLTIDSLLSVELVTADGRTVRASADQNPDLFWGLRGAGPNFGIVTSFDFQLHELADGVTQGWIVHPIDRLDALAATFRELAERGLDELTASFGLGWALPEEEYPPELAGRPVVYLSILHCGSAEAAERDLELLNALRSAAEDTIRRKDYLSTQALNDEEMGWGHRFYMNSGFMASLPDDALDIGVRHVMAKPATGDSSLSIWTWGRAIAEVPEEATAFTGRGARYWFAAETMWDDPASDDVHKRWARDVMGALSPHLMSGRYVNDVAETDRGTVRTVYGDTKYERLVSVKRAWDPDNVFSLNQNIRP